MRSSLADPEWERGAPLFDPDVTSVTEETISVAYNLAQGQRCSVRGSNRQPPQTKESRHGGKVGHVLPRSRYVSFHWLQLPSSTFLSQIKLYTFSRLNGKCLVVVATHFQNGIIVGG